MITEYLKQRLFVLHLSLIAGIGPAIIMYIIRNKIAHDKSMGSASWDDLYAFTHSDWVMMGISEKNAILIAAGLSDHTLLEQELVRIDAHQVQWVTVYDDEYPALLKHINQPPIVLYYRGAPFDKNAKNIAIVGSRSADSYAQRVIDLFVPSLVGHNWSIVSGGALGVDSMAHQAALAAQGKTVAVLGSGLLRLYPKSNTKLFEQIVESGGTLVSSFALTIEPFAGNFPARNRIIAGLSSGCIVVQAAYKSGASITAQYSLDQGRSVFAVPGMIDNPLSVGCHMLLQEGATVADSVDTVLMELGEPVPNCSAVGQQLTIAQDTMATKPTKLRVQRASDMQSSSVASDDSVGNIDTGTSVNSSVGSNSRDSDGRNTAPAATTPVSLAYTADSIECQIIRFCARPISLDEIAQHCSLSCTQAQQLLVDLQLDGVVHQNFAGQWVSC